MFCLFCLLDVVDGAWCRGMCRWGSSLSECLLALRAYHTLPGSDSSSTYFSRPQHANHHRFELGEALSPGLRTVSLMLGNQTWETKERGRLLSRLRFLSHLLREEEPTWRCGLITALGECPGEQRGRHFRG